MQDSAVGLGSSRVLYALDAINQAIKRGYDVTNREMGERNYDPRISKTAFAQDLHHNINQQVFDVGGNSSDVVTDLPPNARRSHHHVMAVVDNVCIRLSSVKKRDGVPRYAAYRSRFWIVQSYFRINADGRLETVDVPDPYDPDSAYVQILHGPSSETFRQHGFTVFRLQGLDDKYSEEVVDLDEFLASSVPITTDVETVTEDFDIPIISLEGASRDEDR